jgi:hypothetical protein
MLASDSNIEKDDGCAIAGTANNDRADVEGGVADCSEKRKATEQLIEQLTVPSKRKCNNQKQPDDMQARVENCRIGK